MSESIILMQELRSCLSGFQGKASHPSAARAYRESRARFCDCLVSARQERGLAME
ncbi:hypothetical protein [uncultured Helicobacter sp.]|uniref:hypothetical protein n=1 Tax=uncultured Helicobacter sp. TaxID=175537 RepID=UPI00374E38D3